MAHPGDDTSLPKNFQHLAWANMATQSAEQIALAAASIVAVLLFGATMAETGVLQTALTLPFVLFALPFGLLADRMPRRRLLLQAEAVRAVTLVALCGLLLVDALTWPALAALGFIGVCGTVAFSVASPALVPSLVPANALATANARVELGRTLAFTAGPALGGVLVGWAGAATAFACAAIMSILATAWLARLEEPARPPVARQQPLLEIREGASFVIRCWRRFSPPSSCSVLSRSWCWRFMCPTRWTPLA